MEKASDAELEIMRAVWRRPGRGMLFAEIQEDLASRALPSNKNQLTVLLSRLVQTGYLCVHKCGRKNLYEARVAEVDYQQEQTQVLLDTAFGGKPWGLVANLVSGDALTEAEIEELRQLLAEKSGEKT